MKDILFDLDGTLTDPKVGITKSVAHALRYYGIEVEDLDTLKPFIGPPLYASFEHYYGFSHEQAVEAVEKYREYFSVTGLFENAVYDGIPQALERLTAAGCRLYVATSKPTVFSVRILEHFELKKWFTDVVGSELDGRRVNKDEVVQACLTDNWVERAVMVGDRSYDMIGAKRCGLTAVGALWGYGSEQELREAGADHICASPAELADLLLSL